MAAVNPPLRATGESNVGARDTPSAVPVTDSVAFEHVVHVTFTVTVELCPAESPLTEMRPML